MTITRSTRYRLQVDTLTPLHIGSGHLLRRDFEYVIHNGQTWMIEPDAIAEQIYATGAQEAEWQKLLAGQPPGSLLEAQDFRPDSSLFRYVLRGEPRSQERQAPVRELIKALWHKPYLPGSSLKGAIRTAVLAEAYRHKKMQYEPDELGNSPRFAAQSLERELASTAAPRNKAPNYDIFRALHVSDSKPDAERRIILAAAAVYAGKDDLIPIALECIPKDVRFTAQLLLDRPLLQGYGPKHLGWDVESHVQWLNTIRQRLNNFSRRRIQEEYQYWKGRSSNLEAFYLQLFGQLDTVMSDKNARVAYLQLGWGGGWTSKTFGALLTRDNGRFDHLVRRYPGALNPQRSYQSGQQFPKSRKVILNREGTPVTVLGWIKMQWEREA